MRKATKSETGSVKGAEKEHEKQKRPCEQEINAHWIFIRLNETAIKLHFLRLSPGEAGGIEVALEPALG